MLAIKEMIKATSDRHLVTGVLCLIILILIHLFDNSFFSVILEQDSLNKQNLKYLTDLRNNSIENYTLLAGIHSLLLTIESSHLGFSIIVDANVKIGNEITALTLLANRGKLYFEVFTVASEMTVLIIYLTYFVIPIIFKATLFSGSLYGFSKWLNRRNSPTLFFKVTRLGIFLLVILHFSIPYSVHLAAITSEYLEGKQDTHMQQYAKHIHAEYVGGKQTESNTSRAKSALDKSESIVSDIENKVASFFRYISQYLLHKILTVLIIPILLFVGLYLIARYIIIKGVKLAT